MKHRLIDIFSDISNIVCESVLSNRIPRSSARLISSACQQEAGRQCPVCGLVKPNPTTLPWQQDTNNCVWQAVGLSVSAWVSVCMCVCEWENSIGHVFVVGGMASKYLLMQRACHYFEWNKFKCRHRLEAMRRVVELTRRHSSEIPRDKLVREPFQLQTGIFNFDILSALNAVLLIVYENQMKLQYAHLPLLPTNIPISACRSQGNNKSRTTTANDNNKHKKRQQKPWTTSNKRQATTTT